MLQLGGRGPGCGLQLLLALAVSETAARSGTIQLQSFWSCTGWGIENRHLDIRFKCDGHLDCDDGSDELNCSGTCSEGAVPCADGSGCRRVAYWCDGVRDCDDNSDERDCEARRESEGRQQRGIPWKSSINFTLPRELPRVRYSSSVKCDGRLDQRGYEDERGCCECSEDAILCASPFQSHTFRCIPPSRICDNVLDCLHGTDEDSDHCNSTTRHNRKLSPPSDQPATPHRNWECDNAATHSTAKRTTTTKTATNTATSASTNIATNTATNAETSTATNTAAAAVRMTNEVEVTTPITLPLYAWLILATLINIIVGVMIFGLWHRCRQATTTTLSPQAAPPSSGMHKATSFVFMGSAPKQTAQPEPFYEEVNLQHYDEAFLLDYRSTATYRDLERARYAEPGQDLKPPVDLLDTTYGNIMYAKPFQ